MDNWDVSPFNNELRRDAAAWELGTKNKKEKKEGKVDENIPEGRKSKRAKLEKLVNWGRTDEDEEIDLRSWLIKDDTETNNEKEGQGGYSKGENSPQRRFLTG